MDYKAVDMQKIIDYIASFYGAVSVDDIIQNSGLLHFNQGRVYAKLVST